MCWTTVTLILRHDPPSTHKRCLLAAESVGWLGVSQSRLSVSGGGSGPHVSHPPHRSSRRLGHTSLADDRSTEILAETPRHISACSIQSANIPLAKANHMFKPSRKAWEVAMARSVDSGNDTAFQFILIFLRGWFRHSPVCHVDH